MNEPTPARVGELVDHLFRHRAGMMTATLTRIFGPEQIDLVEEVVQDSLLRALETWPYTGIPANPSAWLVETAKHRAIDALRHRALGDRISARLLHEWNWMAEEDSTVLRGEVADDVLGLLLLCCDPRIPANARGPLALSTVAGFSVNEIAAALLAKPAAIAQRVVRAKRQIRKARIAFEVPAGPALAERIDSLLSVLYLWFNEGYLAHSGTDLVRLEVAREAMRLCQLVVSRPETGLPACHALMALMFFHAARFPARLDKNGELVTLADQDRARWDHALVNRAFLHLEQSAGGDAISTYHLEAGIAACHARAPSFEETDFEEIVELYDALYRLRPSPLLAFHRAVARSQLLGPATAIDEIEKLSQEAVLGNYHLVFAVLGRLNEQMGRWNQASLYYEQALTRRCTEPERRLLERRLQRTCSEKRQGT